MFRFELRLPSRSVVHTALITGMALTTKCMVLHQWCGIVFNTASSPTSPI